MVLLLYLYHDISISIYTLRKTTLKICRFHVTVCIEYCRDFRLTLSKSSFCCLWLQIKPVFLLKTLPFSLWIVLNINWYQMRVSTWIGSSKGSYRSEKKVIKVWMMMKRKGELLLLSLPSPVFALAWLTRPRLSRPACPWTYKQSIS